MTTTHILDEDYREAMLATPDTLRVGIMACLDKNGDIGLCDRWAKPFEKIEMEVVKIPVGTENISEILECLDGLLMPGGHSNIHPSFYAGANAPTEEDLYDYERDVYAIELLKEAYSLDIPVLGVCRGMQEMVVAFGGALEKLDDDPINHAQGYAFDGDHEKMDAPVHWVSVVPGGIFSGLYRRTEFEVNSIHFYGLKEEGWNLGDQFQIELLAPDGVIEAMSAKGKGFFIGVQPHFEWEGRLHDRLFGAFFDAIHAHHAK